jgi:hypothetical protein
MALDSILSTTHVSGFVPPEKANLLICFDTTHDTPQKIHRRVFDKTLKAGDVLLVQKPDPEQRPTLYRVKVWTSRKVEQAAEQFQKEYKAIKARQAQLLNQNSSEAYCALRHFLGEDPLEDFIIERIPLTLENMPSHERQEKIKELIIASDSLLQEKREALLQAAQEAFVKAIAAEYSSNKVTAAIAPFFPGDGQPFFKKPDDLRNVVGPYPHCMIDLG